MRIYLDVCCLSRPFDDQSQAKIHLESEAVLSILEKIFEADWVLIDSDAVKIELSNIPDRFKYQRIKVMMDKIRREYIRYNPEIIARAQRLHEIGFGRMDALHIACAEAARVDVFLSTDDKILRLAKRHSVELKVVVENPLMWIQELEGQ